jgi:hypothetical protein
MSINFGERKTQRYSSQSVEGLQLNAIMSVAKSESTTGNPEALVCDWTNVYVSVILSQHGKEHTIISSNVSEIARAFAINNSTFSNATDTGSIPYGTETELSAIYLPFGQVLNVGAEDVLTVEVTANPMAKPAKRDGYIAAALLEGVGVQFCNPKINVQAIPNGESQYSITLGDNVTNVFLIGNAANSRALESSPGYEAGTSQWIQNVRLFSDRLNITASRDELANEHFQGYDSQELAASTYAYKCFHILDKEVDKCRLQLDLNPSSVTSGQFYIVYTTYTSNKKQVLKGLRKEAKHERYDIGKLK